MELGVGSRGGMGSGGGWWVDVGVSCGGVGMGWDGNGMWLDRGGEGGCEDDGVGV